MSEFKVGDKVRIVNVGRYWQNCEGVVYRLGDDIIFYDGSPLIKVRMTKTDPTNIYQKPGNLVDFKPSQLELIEPEVPKRVRKLPVGTPVYFRQDVRYPALEFKGVITSYTHDDSDYDYYLASDDGVRTTHPAYEHEVTEHVHYGFPERQATLAEQLRKLADKIEEGDIDV